MQQIQLGDSELTSSRLAFGCMRIAGDGSADARASGKRAVRAGPLERLLLVDHAVLHDEIDVEQFLDVVER